MKPKLSKWFSGDQRPQQIGMYERRLDRKQYGRHAGKRAFWDGRQWLVFYPLPPYPAYFDQPHNGGQHFEWRGLAQPPELQKR